MGRKPGSKNKPKEPQYAESKLEAVVQAVDEVLFVQKKIEQLKHKPVQSVGKSIDIDKVFPSDWDKMGKIARLEWLTAHPRKK